MEARIPAWETGEPAKRRTGEAANWRISATAKQKQRGHRGIRLGRCCGDRALSCLAVPTGSRQGAQVTEKPLVRLNVLTVQKLAALRYNTW
jgi:hypothetical protein